MMGIDAETMTQEDIDKSIEYLFPAGLKDKHSNPVMKPPEEVYPSQKDAEFDFDGRPYHPFFYTRNPNFCKIMFDIVEQYESCVHLSDRLISQRRKPDEKSVLDAANMLSSRWVTFKELREMTIETDITKSQYDEFISTLERFVAEPFSYNFKEFIFKFRKDHTSVKTIGEVPMTSMDQDGREFIEAVGQRKSACAKVRVTKPGTGKFTITHIDYPDYEFDTTYFYSFYDRHQLLFPLQFTKLLEEVDVECLVGYGGSSSQAGAIRYALSSCLRSFVNEQMRDDMKIAGLLTQNIRTRERKNVGMKGARARYKWLKR